MLQVDSCLMPLFNLILYIFYLFIFLLYLFSFPTLILKCLFDVKHTHKAALPCFASNIPQQFEAACG